MGWFRQSGDRRSERAESSAQTQAVDTADALLAALELSSEGVCVLDAALRVVVLNPRARDLLGLPPHQVGPGSSQAEILHHMAELGVFGAGDVDAQVAERLANARAIAEGKRGVVQQWERTFPGGRVVEIRAKPLAGGGQVRLYRDVTDLRRSEAEVARQAQLLRTMVDAIPQRLSVKDRDGRYLMGNRAMVTTHDAEAEPEILGKRPSDLPALPPDEAAAMEALDRQVLETGQAVDLPEARIGGTRERARYYHVRKLPLTDATGAVSGLVTVREEVTARVEDREALRRSEAEVARQAQLLRTVFDTIPQRLSVKDAEGRYLMVNRALADAHGMTPQAFPRLLPQDVAGRPAAESELVRELDQTVLREGRMVELPELRLEDADGKCHFLHLRKLPLQDDSGHTIGVVTVREDVTERVRARIALQQSEARLLQAERIAQAGHWEWDLENNTVFWSDELCRLIGWDPTQGMPTPEQVVAVVHPDDRAAYNAAHSAALRSGRALSLELRVTRMDGDVRDVTVQAEVERDTAGRATRIMGVSRDITARKRAEAELRASQRLLRMVLDSVPQAIAVKDREGRYRMANRALTHLYGTSEGELIGKHLHDLWPQWTAALERAWQAEQEAMRTGRSVVLDDFELHLPTGQQVARHTVKLPLLDEQGRSIGVIGVAEDITELRRTEAELRSSQRLLRTVLDTVPHWLMVKDRQGHYLMVNRAMAKFYDTTPEALVGRSFHDISLDSADAPRLTDEMDRAVLLHGRVADNPNVEVRRPDGALSLRHVIKLPLHDEAGQIVGIVALSMDVTEQRRLQEQLTQSQKMEALGQLAGGVAHDFNNILMLVMGNLELLLRDAQLESRELDSVQRAMAAAERGAAITHRILAFSRKQTLKPQPTDLNALLQGLLPLLRTSVGDGVSVVAELAEDLFPVLVDAGQLEHALLNLAVNARDAMPGGGELRLTTGNLLFSDGSGQPLGLAAGDYVHLTVADTGEGMDEHTRQRALEPFFTTKAVDKGTGLGLSTVYGFMRQSGGALTLQSEPGAGTAVGIVLPRAVHGQAAASRNEWATPPAANLPVLVVEDEPTLRDVVTDMLEDLGYTPLVVPDGPAALGLLATHPRVALLFTDVMLPGGMNGLELAQVVQQHSPDLPVLFTTGYTDSALMQQIKAVPRSAVLAKPYRVHVLAEQIAALLKHDAPEPVERG